MKTEIMTLFSWSLYSNNPEPPVDVSAVFSATSLVVYWQPGLTADNLKVFILSINQRQNQNGKL